MKRLWLFVPLGLTWPQVDAWMDLSMTAQMVGVIPLLLYSGSQVARSRPWPGPTPPWAMAGLVLALGTALFWMLPRALDLAVAKPQVDLAMHAALLVAGLGLGWCLPRLGLIVQIAVGIYTSAMWAAMALVLIHSASPVCARFTLAQQQVAGTSMLWLGGVFWLLHLANSIQLLRQGAKLPAVEPQSL